MALESPASFYCHYFTQRHSHNEASGGLFLCRKLFCGYCVSSKCACARERDREITRLSAFLQLEPTCRSNCPFLFKNLTRIDDFWITPLSSKLGWVAKCVLVHLCVYAWVKRGKKKKPSSWRSQGSKWWIFIGLFLVFQPCPFLCALHCLSKTTMQGNLSCGALQNGPAEKLNTRGEHTHTHTKHTHTLSFSLTQPSVLLSRMICGLSIINSRGTNAFGGFLKVKPEWQPSLCHCF